MGKPKHKSRKKRQPDLEFVAPYQLEECVARLQDLSKSRKWLLVNTRVKLAQVDAMAWHFKVSRSVYAFPRVRWTPGYGTSRSNYVKVEVEGTLFQKGDLDSTLVVLSARISPKTFLVNGVWLIMFVPGLGPLCVYSLLHGLILLLAAVLILSVALVYLTLYQPQVLSEEYLVELLEQIGGTLGHRQRKL